MVKQLPQPLVGKARDEIEELVMRIREGDARARAPRRDAPLVSREDLAWAEGQELPREFFEFFELQRG